MDKVGLIETCWNDFRKHVIHKDASKIQIQDMHEAFFAGATILYSIIMSSLQDEETPENEAKEMMLMDSIHNELIGFGNSVTMQSLMDKVLK